MNVFKTITTVALTLALTLVTAQPSSAATTTVNVNFGSNLSAVPPLGLGVASAVYDNSLVNSGTASRIAQAGMKTVRYPGGSYADDFHWQTTAMCAGAYINSSDSFDNFINNVVIPAGAKAVITVAYGSNSSCNGGGDPNEAAAWVQYANISRGLGIRYWEVGNEQQGNGFYGTKWEEDLYADQSPAAYGRNFVLFANAMKAKDSSIKVGAPIVAPGTWPDNVNPPYNHDVLTNAGNAVDFVIIHYYPGGAESALLQSTSQIAGIVSATRSQLNSYLGSHGSQVEIAVTETGSGAVVGPAAALFAADDYLTWFENGAVNVDWQELHNNFLTSGVSGMPDNSPAGPFYGAQMTGMLASPADTLVSASSGSNLVAVHAVRKANGSYGMLLINKDPSNSYTVAVNVSGATLGSSATRYDFGAANFSGQYPFSGPSQSTLGGIGASSFSITVPAYSMSLVNIPAGSGGTGGIVANGTYKVIARQSGKALDVTGHGAGDGTNVEQWTYNGGNNQRWTLTNLGGNVYEFLGVESGKALEVASTSTTDGTNVDIRTYSGASNQRWTITATDSGYYRLSPVSSSASALDVTGASATDGANVEQWSWNGGNNQQWALQAP